MLHRRMFTSLCLGVFLIVFCFLYCSNARAAKVVVHSSAEYADIALKNGRMLVAITAYSEAIREKPTEAALYVNRARCFIESNNKELIDDALIDCDKALELQPDLSWAYVTKADALMRIGGVLKATPLYEKAVAMEPLVAYINYRLACAYHFVGRNKEAIAIYEKVLEMDAEYVDAYTGCGTAYRHEKNLDKAIEYYSTAIKLQPMNEYLYYNRARAYEDVGEFKLAAVDYNKGEELRKNKK